MRGYVIKYDEKDPRCNGMVNEVFCTNSVTLDENIMADGIGVKEGEYGITNELGLEPKNFAIGFIVQECEWAEEVDDCGKVVMFTRHIKRAVLRDVSIISS